MRITYHSRFEDRRAKKSNNEAKLNTVLDKIDTTRRPGIPLSLAFASWDVGMRERERVWWNDGFVRRTEGDELFGFGVYRVCRIVQRKMGAFSRFFSLRALFPLELFSRFSISPPTTSHSR
jgi:hypothetical protein